MGIHAAGTLGIEFFHEPRDTGCLFHPSVSRSRSGSCHRKRAPSRRSPCGGRVANC
jgi:hypothetical protein